jgi:hypothetical protein
MVFWGFVQLWIFYDEKIQQCKNKGAKKDFSEEPKPETCRFYLVCKQNKFMHGEVI